jgi:argininosuccinate lyase
VNEEIYVTGKSTCSGVRRFAGGPAEAMAALSKSTHFDWRLARYDLAGSSAHAGALHRAGLLSRGRPAGLLAGSRSLTRTWRRAGSRPPSRDEDVHSALRGCWSQRLGPELGGRLRAGRSRNDQIATLLRMYLRDHARLIAQAVLDLVQALADQAVPTRTRDARAAPTCSTLSRCCWPSPAGRTAGRCCATWSGCWTGNSGRVSPYGRARWPDRRSGSNPEAVAADLGFESSVPNSIDGTAVPRPGRRVRLRHRDDRRGSLPAVRGGDHLGDEGVLLLTLDDAWSTGSSIMPQKKNPGRRRARPGARPGRLIGDLTGLLATLKACRWPTTATCRRTRNRCSTPSTPSSCCCPPSPAWSRRWCSTPIGWPALAPQGFALATDVAEWLVRHGVPFRDAHEIAGGCVRRCEQRAVAEGRSVELWDLTDEDLSDVSPLLTPDGPHGAGHHRQPDLPGRPRRDRSPAGRRTARPS